MVVVLSSLLKINVIMDILLTASASNHCKQSELLLPR